MADALHDLVKTLEHRREMQLDCTTTLAIEPVRQLDIPLSHIACLELRALASVFQCDEQQLAAAVLQAGLLTLKDDLDEDLDKLAERAKALIESPCLQASEVI